MNHLFHKSYLSGHTFLFCPSLMPIKVFNFISNLKLWMKFSIRNIHDKTKLMSNHPCSGLSFRAGSQGFPLATMNVASSYFHWKIEEK